jgi:hypothetical protein
VQSQLKVQLSITNFFAYVTEIKSDFDGDMFVTLLVDDKYIKIRCWFNGNFQIHYQSERYVILVRSQDVKCGGENYMQMQIIVPENQTQYHRFECSIKIHNGRNLHEIISDINNLSYDVVRNYQLIIQTIKLLVKREIATEIRYIPN